MINYYLLMKPGIILGNLLTVAAGFILASKGEFDLILFLATLIGLGLIMASGCVFNNYIDRPLDKKMNRTKKRALVVGSITPFKALVFGEILLILGNIVLLAYTNLLATLIADMGFVVYVLLYSLWKSQTPYGTAIGSVAGAIPPVVGYCAVSNDLDLGAVLLFAMMIFWQMPHFFAIALFRFDDYKKAGIPALPHVKGINTTKERMFPYIIAFALSASLLTFFNYTGLPFLIIVLLSSAVWLLLAYQGFSTSNNEAWGRQMFRLSLVVITLISVTIPLEIIF